MRSRRRTLAVVVVLSFALLGVTAGSAGAFPVVGLNIANVPTDAQIATAHTLGAKSVRMFLLWKDAEPAKGRFDALLISRYVQIVRELNADGIATDFVVTRAPSWETGSSDVTHAPANPADFADFISQLAAMPGLVGNHIAYELWNEEDAPQWWSPAPDDKAYAALVKAAAPALHAADPTATVVLGPTTGNNYDFIGQLYSDGIGGLTDAVAVHTDNLCLVDGPDSTYMQNGRIGQFAFLAYKEVHATMVAHGEGSHPIWMTEFGWNSSQSDTGGPACPGEAKPSGVTPQQQAQFITQAFHCMGQDPYLAVANWFTLDDDPTVDQSQGHYGLESAGGAPKPAFAAFQTLATQGDQLTGQCGDFAGPAITIQQPKVGTTYASDLPIMASATDPQGVTRISFYPDQSMQAIDNFVHPANDAVVGLDWHGASDLSIGTHTINVVAVDKSGNQSTASVIVKKVSLNQILAVGPIHVTLKKLTCKASSCTLTGSGTTPAGDPLPGGLMQARWQLLTTFHMRHHKITKKFRLQHKGLVHANKPFTFSQRLKPGQWRVQVVFEPPSPLKQSASPWRYFTVKGHAKRKKKHH